MLAANGRLALDMIARQGLPHLAVVDINMPVMNGIQFCRAVHRFCDLPFIMLTAVDDETTMVEVIQECAEDYVTKPFSLNELMARIHRVLRRFPDHGHRRIVPIEANSRVSVDFGAHVLTAGEQTAQLTPTETKLLHILMSNRRRTVSTEFLLSRLWPREEIFEDTLRVHIHRLRRKLELLDPNASYIETERGLGYRFAAVGELVASN
jgi:DNA-binding response OmpR family regulator